MNCVKQPLESKVRKWDVEKDGVPKMFIDDGNYYYSFKGFQDGYPMYYVVGKVTAKKFESDISKYDFESYILSAIEKASIIKKYEQINKSWEKTCKGECPYTFSVVLNDHMKLKFSESPVSIFSKIKAWWKNINIKF